MGGMCECMHMCGCAAGMCIMWHVWVCMYICIYLMCACVGYDVCGICVSACDAYTCIQIYDLCVCVCGMCVYVWCVHAYVCEVYVLCVCLGYVLFVCLRIVYVCESCVWFGGMYVYGGLLINMLLLKKKCLQFLSPPIHAPLCSRVIFPKHKAELSLSLLKGKKRKKKGKNTFWKGSQSLEKVSEGPVSTWPWATFPGLAVRDQSSGPASPLHFLCCP